MSTRVRRTSGLVLVAMLNLIFQPCAMAMEMDADHPCPHCPTESSQVQHHQDPQLSKLADCDYVDSYSHDSRTVQTKDNDLLKDQLDFVDGVFSISVPAIQSCAYKRASHIATYSSGPPLSILYCVYLK
jgi:hypothetical protein